MVSTPYAEDGRSSHRSGGRCEHRTTALRPDGGNRDRSRAVRAVQSCRDGNRSASSQAYLSCTLFLKRIAPRARKCSKSTGLWKPTGRTSRPRISGNTKRRRKKSSGRSSLSRPRRLCLARRRRFEPLSPGNATLRPAAQRLRRAAAGLGNRGDTPRKWRTPASKHALEASPVEVRLHQTFRQIGEAETCERRMQHLGGGVED
jgi:hypothetical protein